MKTCAEMIKDLRQDRDLKQSDLAKLIGTTQQQYSKYENGSTEIPLRVIIALADFYDVSIDFLLSRNSNNDEYFVFVTNTERKLLEAWSKIDKEQQSLLLKLIESM